MAVCFCIPQNYFIQLQTDLDIARSMTLSHCYFAVLYLVVMEMAAQAMGRIAACSGSYRTEHIAFQVRRSIEWLSNEKNEGKKQAAVRYFNFL